MIKYNVKIGKTKAALRLRQKEYDDTTALFLF